MSEEDPTEELEEIIDLVENRHLPEPAGTWALSCLETVEGILETIERMTERGQEPTEKQLAALARIHAGACKWLRRDA